MVSGRRINALLTPCRRPAQRQVAGLDRQVVGLFREVAQRQGWLVARARIARSWQAPGRGCGQVDRPRLGLAARGQVSSGFALSGLGRTARQVEWRLAARSNGAGLVELRLLAAGMVGRRAGVAGPGGAKATWQPQRSAALLARKDRPVEAMGGRGGLFPARLTEAAKRRSDQARPSAKRKARFGLTV